MPKSLQGATTSFCSSIGFEWKPNLYSVCLVVCLDPSYSDGSCLTLVWNRMDDSARQLPNFGSRVHCERGWTEQKSWLFYNLDRDNVNNKQWSSQPGQILEEWIAVFNIITYKTASLSVKSPLFHVSDNLQYEHSDFSLNHPSIL